MSKLLIIWIVIILCSLKQGLSWMIIVKEIYLLGKGINNFGRILKWMIQCWQEGNNWTSSHVSTFSAIDSSYSLPDNVAIITLQVQSILLSDDILRWVILKISCFVFARIAFFMFLESLHVLLVYHLRYIFGFHQGFTVTIQISLFKVECHHLPFIFPSILKYFIEWTESNNPGENESQLSFPSSTNGNK